MQDTVVHSASTAETEAIGAKIAEAVLAGTAHRYIALYGDLGVGKTAFVRGFTKRISPASAVRSPTFALVNEYRGGVLPIFHFDMYRITGEDDLYSIGYDDYLEKDAVCLVEWSENIPFALPAHYLKVEIQKDDETVADSRLLTVTDIIQPN